MTTTDHRRPDTDHHDGWFDRVLAYAQLVGGVQGWADAALSPDGCSNTAALAEIRRLLDAFTAEQAANHHNGDRP